MAATPEQAAALAAIAAAVHETHAQQQRISAAAAILAASLGDAPPSTDIDDYLRACGHVQAPALKAGNQQARRFTDG